MQQALCGSLIANCIMIGEPGADFILSGSDQNPALIVDKEAHDLIVTDTDFAHVMRKLAEQMPITPSPIGLELVLVASYSSTRQTVC